MRVSRIRVVSTPVELVNPLVTAEGTHGSRDAVLVEVATTDGVIGWGENVAPVGVAYVGESRDASIKAMVEQLAPRLLGRDIEVATIDPGSWWGIDGHCFAKHALESALWDAEARTLGVPLSVLLGASRDHITPGVVVGVGGDIENVVRECEQRIAEGYRRVKLKIAPGRDLAVLATVRAAIGDGVILQADANGSYGPDDIDHVANLADSGLQFIEQPFAADDIDSHVALMRTGSVPVCMDESIGSHRQMVEMLDRGACSIVNVKPARVGGIAEAVRMHDTLLAEGVDAWVGGMLETGVGRASALAVAAMPGFTLTPDLSASNRYFARDLTEPFVLDGGRIAVPTGPGIGVEPLDRVLADRATRIEAVHEG